MYNKLTSSELRIVEQTQREGEELAAQEAAVNGSKPHPMRLIKSMLVWMAALSALILLGYFLLWLGQKVAG